ncbi:multiple stress resistance protein BhsA, partial [Pectobacterium versatile]|nr:multiple stress resistance protein BhsA [Pectobacterium versatile]
MKSIKTVVAAVALATLSFGALAATEVQSVQRRDLGTVSATGHSLDDLQAQLS